MLCNGMVNVCIVCSVGWISGAVEEGEEDDQEFVRPLAQVSKDNKEVCKTLQFNIKLLTQLLRWGSNLSINYVYLFS